MLQHLDFLVFLSKSQVAHIAFSLFQHFIRLLSFRHNLQHHHSSSLLCSCRGQTDQWSVPWSAVVIGTFHAMTSKCSVSLSARHNALDNSPHKCTVGPSVGLANKDDNDSAD